MKVCRVEGEAELVFAVGRVERRGGRTGRHREERQRHLRPVWQHDRHAVVALDAERPQLPGEALDARTQLGMRERGAVRRCDRGGTVVTGVEQLDQGVAHAPRKSTAHAAGGEQAARVGLS